MRFFGLCLLAGLFHLSLKAQLSTFQYLEEDYYADELYLGLSTRHVNLEFPNALPAENHRMSAWTGDFLLYRTNLEPGGMRYLFRNKILGEIFYGFGEDFTDIARAEGSTFSHFLIGAHDFNWNLWVRDRWALAMGFNLTDLALGSTFIVKDSLGYEHPFTPAPHGWYVGLGPALMADYLISDFFLLELQADYTFHLKNLVPLSYGEKAPDIAMPHQYFLSAHLLTSWGLYTGIEASFLNDRSAYNGDARKLEWHFGFRLML
ncbi:hypothetical protein [Croceimicrobium sp.]|uniref:hypothetical protein n=1 Tax=Croceimicrobium sp. TaxID=2828340 RepID=UPI003BAD2E65